MAPAFDSPDLLRWLDTASPADLDALPFGVIAMAPDTTVVSYNRAEGELSGLAPARVIGRPFFASVARCVDNDMIAGRYERAAVLDATVNAVFIFKAAPVHVRLRLLKHPDARRIYLAVIGRQ
jgi:photoactive yellow protein